MPNIRITYSRERWEALARRAREKAEAAAELARSGAEALRARTRLEREIQDLQEEISLQMQAIGEITYAAHKGRAPEEETVRQIMEYVDGLYGQMEARRQELEAARGPVVCTACGAENDPEYAYCGSCGQPLSK